MCWLCCVMLQMGKVHFGVLLGWSVVQSIVLWFMVNQIASNEAAEHRALDLYSCCCIVGYGMVPLLVLSIAVLFTPRWVQQQNRAYRWTDACALAWFCSRLHMLSALHWNHPGC